MPTGTGKTETMLSLLIANKCEKVLVTVPTDPLREQLSKKFKTLGLLKNEEFNVIEPDAHFPIVGVLKENFKTLDELKLFVEKCNVVVTTMDLISNNTVETQQTVAGLFSHLFIDEAHHSAAASWLKFRDLFQPYKVLQFTATPYRNDGQRVDGKIIFNYPLSKAQKDGYFKKISFKPILEYDSKKADLTIAEKAVSQLREDLQSYEHILMARCNSKSRANEVFKIYKQYEDLNPVIIHTGLSSTERKETLNKIINREAKIIVCVDMLGEGFDLPNLKIAAFHDIRKSLPITVQLAGRFTRTAFDSKLGEATIFANLADTNVQKELEEFYSHGADWNAILPMVSTSSINKEIDFSNFISGFAELENSKIPFHSLYDSLSAVVYKNKTSEWFPRDFKRGLPSVDEYDYLFHDINSAANVLVVITGKKNLIKWGNTNDFYNIDWNLIIAYWDTKHNLLFIHSSDNNGFYKELATALIGEDAELIKKSEVFKAFYNIKRVRLQNVGLKEFLGKHISFRMSTGYDVERALSIAEKQKGEKAFVFGIGYEEGEKVTLGCSYKGRIWSYSKGNLKQFIDLCNHVGSKLIRDDIDGNSILKETLIPNSISNRPNVIPFAIDWNADLYSELEIKYSFSINGIEHKFYNSELRLSNPSQIGNLTFELVVDDTIIVNFEKVLFKNNDYDDFNIKEINGAHNVKVLSGNKSIDIEDFFYKYPPSIWFVDGSYLSGNEYIELKHHIPNYPKEKIISWKWDGVNLSNESQHVEPKVTDSIQYRVIQELKSQNFDIIYDDDYSGEIADVVTLKRYADHILVQFYHLKYAKSGKVSQKVDDLYEVCGQAQKSINWKFKEGKEFIEHLLRRETKKRKGKTCSRLEVGTKNDLEFFKEITRKQFPVEFEIFIVQPGISSSKPSEEQLNLLGVTENYLKERAQIDLKVIGS